MVDNQLDDAAKIHLAAGVSTELGIPVGDVLQG